jgi:ribonuclease PH
MRHDGRRPKQLREVKLTRNVNAYAEGSCLIEMGATKVQVTATVDQKIPGWLKGSDKGWVTAEYGMLPRANRDRSRRGRKSGRDYEIQRLIGRSLRAVTDLKLMTDMQIILDCDVMQADGGTRCASITAAYVALHDALKGCLAAGDIKRMPLTDSLAGISVGIVDGNALLDLDYVEDSGADVDANFVITGRGRLVEIQITGEESTFSDEELSELLALARFGAKKLTTMQRKVLRSKGK